MQYSFGSVAIERGQVLLPLCHIRCHENPISGDKREIVACSRNEIQSRWNRTRGNGIRFATFFRIPRERKIVQDSRCISKVNGFESNSIFSCDFYFSDYIAGHGKLNSAMRWGTGLFISRYFHLAVKWRVFRLVRQPVKLIGFFSTRTNFHSVFKFRSTKLCVSHLTL